MLDLEVVRVSARVVQQRRGHLPGRLVPAHRAPRDRHRHRPADLQEERIVHVGHDAVRGDLPLRHELLVVADKLEHQVARPRLDLRVHKERFVELSLSIQPPNDGAVLDGAQDGVVHVYLEISR